MLRHVLSTIIPLFILFIFANCQPEQSNSLPLGSGSGDTTDSGGVVTCVNNCAGESVEVATETETQTLHGGENPPLAGGPEVISTKAEEHQPIDTCEELCVEFNGGANLSEACQEAIAEQCRENACTSYRSNAIPHAVDSVELTDRYSKMKVAVEFCNGGFTAVIVGNSSISMSSFRTARLPIIEFGEVPNPDGGAPIQCDAEFIDHFPRNGIPTPPDVGRGTDCPEALHNTALVYINGSTTPIPFSMPSLLSFDLHAAIENTIKPDGKMIDGLYPAVAITTAVSGPGLVRPSIHKEPFRNLYTTIIEYMFWVDPVNVAEFDYYFVSKDIEE
jgi:hypothetical protein